MATYKEIKGVTVQTKDEDPVQNVGSWASGTNINTARAFTGGAGTQSANLVFGGKYDPTPRAITEQWDGSTWTEVNDLNTTRQSMAAMGTSTSAVAAGGRVSVPTDTSSSETWNGSAWTEGNDLNSERYSIANRGAGTQTAGLCAGGRNKGPGAYDALTEEYNGTSWSEVNDLPAGVESGSGLGTQTAAGLWGGYTGSYRATGLLYDGTNWTSTTDFPFPSGSASESGTTTAGLLFGIYNDSSPGYVANTVSWDGTAFTEENDLATARGAGGGGKAGLNTNQNAIMVGGFESGGTYYANVEDWNFPPVTQDKLKEGMIFLSAGTTLKGFGKAAGIPAATWATGGSLNVTSKNTIQGAGTQTAALSAGGSSGDPAGDTKVATAEEYNGTSWTEVNDLNSAKFICTTTGTQTAAILFGGSPAVAETEHYNGSTWTEVGDLNTGRYEIAAAGGYTAGLAFTGRTPGTTYNSINESWNGSAWSEQADLSTARRGAYGSGSQTAALCSSGSINSAPTYLTPNVESWDGSSWTEIANVNTQRYAGGAAGVQTSTLIIGGYSTPPGDSEVEHWNGTSWTEVNDLSTGRASGASLGGTQSSAAAALYAGGTPPNTAITEEFTADATLSTVTVS